MLRKALFIFSLLFAFGSSAQEFVEDDGFFIRKGYTWSPGAEKQCLITVIDPITGEELQLPRTYFTLPATINGTHVFTEAELKTNGSPAAVTDTLRNYLLRALQPHIRQAWFPAKGHLRSVTIHLSSLVIDTTGRVIFFELSDVTGRGPDGRLRNLEFQRLSDVIGSIAAGAPAMQPATQNGIPVFAYADIDLANTEISFDSSDFRFKEVVHDTTK